MHSKQEDMKIELCKLKEKNEERKIIWSVVAQIVVPIAPESNGTWNENQKEKYVIGHP